MAITFLGIDHVGVAVKDVDAAAATYGDVLGFEVAGGERLDDRGLDVRFVNTGNSRIELIAPTRDDSEVSRFLEKRGEGIHHICIRVSNIEAAVSEITSRGGKLASNGVQLGAHGRRVAFLHPKQSHGVLIELVEHHDDE
jgi:methylmalonyl-CoA epimerase